MPKPYTILNRKLGKYSFTRIKKASTIKSNKLRPRVRSKTIKFKKFKKKHKKSKLCFPQKRAINLILTRKLSNVFLTTIDGRGNVLVSKSAGNCKITSKKRKKSWDTFKAIAQATIKSLRLKNIKVIKNFYLKYSYLKNFKIFNKIFKQSGIPINNLIYFSVKPHREKLKFKKARRL